MREESQVIVTIDGPSGVGKSTISRRVAAWLGFTYLDTGAMYRAVALYCKIKNLDISDSTNLDQELEHIELELFPAKNHHDDVRVVLNNEDISTRIRTPEISMLASQVSALQKVREKLTRMQQDLGFKGRIVAEGRDTGTVVFPNAAFKFYLDASPRERTSRRAKQLRALGREVDEKELLEMTLARDKNDSERALAPLKVAADAIYIDTTTLSADQVLAELQKHLKNARG
ncbi:MAG: (d)CMP kinase [Desulfobulbaceae bacterium]|nr:MAG: (d)CMP kinase [Desulfobulbaceae bacterium]